MLRTAPHRTAPLSALAMVVTFAATTQLLLHTAILIGAITSLVLYCVMASGSAKLTALTPRSDGAGIAVRFPISARATT